MQTFVLVLTTLLGIWETNANSYAPMPQEQYNNWRCFCTNIEKTCYGNAACGKWEYCGNTGHELLENNFVCGPCSRGLYYKKKSALESHQTVKTLPKTETIETCGPVGFGSGSRCTYVTRSIPGTEKTLQACQQCPIFTLVNPVDPISQDVFRGGNTLLENAAHQETRCFTSCYLAWKDGKNTRNTISIKVLSFRSAVEDDNSFDLFTEIDGDRTSVTPPIKLEQSVIAFSSGIDEWLKTNEASLYRDYIKNNHRDKKITLLPAPKRSCKICPDGTSLIGAPVIVNGQLNLEDLQHVIDNINSVATNLRKDIDISAGFSNEISWMNPDSLKDFEFIEVCQQCPPGTFFDMQANDLSKFVFSSKSRTAAIKKINNLHAVKSLDIWKMSQLRCNPCDDGMYRSKIDSVFECKFCKDNQFALLSQQLIKIQIEPGRNYETKSTYLSIECSMCPAGSDKKSADLCTNMVMNSFSTTYWLIVEKNDCCVPCPVNFYKAAGQPDCINVVSNMATKVPYGSIQQIKCQVGTELRSCKQKKVETTELKFKPSLADFCIPTQDINSEDNDWRVCLECTAVERPEKVDLEPRCVMCNGDGEDFKALGEFYNKTTQQCESCDDCSVFEPKVEWRSFFATDADYTNAMSQWVDESNRLDSYRVQNRWHYKHFDITKACKELQRRVLAWDATTNSIKIDGDDRVKVQAREKWKGQLFGEGAVAAFHAVDYERFLDGARRCAARSCETFCDMWYKYSQGCGAGAARADLWVRSADAGGAGAWQALRLVDLEARLRTLAAPAAELAQWQLKHHGQCVECTLCADGQYNPECNAFAQGVRPEGRCEGCTTQCEGGEFLWHKSGLRGCAPLVDELRGRVLTDYVCRRCPTWVRRAERMYAVLGCGFKDTFQWWRTATFAPQYDTLTKAQALAKAEYEHRQVDVKFKPFWHLGAYCPDGYFFNAQEKDCAFKAESGFALHHADMSFGYEAFRLECCQLCDTCDADRYRMTAQYAECTGESMIDTQAKGCGDRCESGFYVKNETALECVACTEC